MQLLTGHISPETAYVVDDYPFGFRLRCKIRYWLEFQSKKGFRLWSQTSNPKRPGLVWNKPKASTYAKFGGAMFLDDNGHVQWQGLNEYCDVKEAQSFQATYGAAVPEAGRVLLDSWVAAKVAYESNRIKDDPLHVGLEQAHKAFLDTALAGHCHDPVTGLALDHNATGWLCAPNGKKIVRMCNDHAAHPIAEYQNKLSETWTFQAD